MARGDDKPGRREGPSDRISGLPNVINCVWRVFRHSTRSRKHEEQFPISPSRRLGHSGLYRRLLDYDLVSSLSEIYQTQEMFRGNMDKIGVSSTDWFDPGARDAAVRKLYMAMIELQYD